MEIVGKIIKVMPIKKGVSQASGKEWMSQSFVLEVPNRYNPQYPDRLVLDIFGEEKLSAINIQAGDDVKVVFYFSAREHNGKWFNSLPVCKVESMNKTESSPAAVLETQEIKSASTDETEGNNGINDLPF